VEIGAKMTRERKVSRRGPVSVESSEHNRADATRRFPDAWGRLNVLRVPVAEEGEEDALEGR